MACLLPQSSYHPSRHRSTASTSPQTGLPLHHASRILSSILAPAASIHAVPVLCHPSDSDCHATCPDAPVLSDLYGFQFSLFCSYICKQLPRSLSGTQ